MEASLSTLVCALKCGFCQYSEKASLIQHGQGGDTASYEVEQRRLGLIVRRSFTLMPHSVS